MKTHLQLIQDQFDSYNNFQLSEFCANFHSEIKVRSLTSEKYKIDGIEAFRSFYAEVFTKFPNQKTTLISRMVLDDMIIDEEIIEGRPSDPNGIHGVCIFAFRDGLIDRIWI